jgi:hypothetical protein
MALNARRRRPKGSLGALQRGLWSVFLRNVEFVEDAAQDIEVRMRASTAAVQAGLAFARTVELYDLEREVKAMEALAHGNGHHPA